MPAIAARGASTRSGMLQTERLALFPYGQPSAADLRERCAEFLLSQRGDLRRIIDAPLGGIERFCLHLRRIAALHGNEERPLVVLTRSSPIACVLACRTRMERELPLLRRATWALLVDRRSDPEFEIAARQIGKLQLDNPDEGAWTSLLGYVFVVVFARVPATERPCLDA